MKRIYPPKWSKFFPLSVASILEAINYFLLEHPYVKEAKCLNLVDVSLLQIFFTLVTHMRNVCNERHAYALQQ